MRKREWIPTAAFVLVLLAAALLLGFVADSMILRHVSNGPPQRLAAAMGGLFGGGLVLFAGLIAWFVRQAN